MPIPVSGRNDFNYAAVVKSTGSIKLTRFLRTLDHVTLNKYLCDPDKSLKFLTVSCFMCTVRIIIAPISHGHHED